MESRYVKDIFEAKCRAEVHGTSVFTVACDPLGKETWIVLVTGIGFSSREKVEHMWLEAHMSTIQVPMFVG